MKVSALAFLTLSSVLLTAACSQQPVATNSDAKATPAASVSPDPSAAVRATFARDCESCHGPEGKGGRVKLDDGSTLRVPSFREGHALRHRDADFVKQIMNGGDGMPAFKDKLNQQQIDDLIRFIRREFQPGVTPPAEPTKKP